MMCTMRRYVALLGLFVLAGAVSAFGQVTYNLTSVPTFVIKDGDSETLGSIRLTATTTNTIIPGTINFYFPGVSCDNDETAGVSLSSSTGIYAPAGSAGVVFAAAGSAVVNSAGGCTVSIIIANAVAGVVGNYIQLDGVRGRIQQVAVAIGGNIVANVFAFPPSSSLIPPPQTTVVASPQPGFTATITSGTQLLCLTEETPHPDIRIVEGFNSAFVQYVPTAGGTPAPLFDREENGANGNTRFAIRVSGVPNGYTKTFPSTVCENTLGCVGDGGSQLELVSGGTVTGTSDPTVVFTVIYEYACHNQSICDTSLESFDIHPDDDGGFTTATPPGQLVAEVEFWPRESVPPPGPTVAPYSGTGGTGNPEAAIVGANSPRFSDTPQCGLGVTCPAPLNRVAPCTSNILFPWVVSNVAQFDTGIAIANTGRDPFGSVGATSMAEHGTCTLYGFPKGEGTVRTLTTPDVSTGDTYTVVLSSTVFNGFAGYIIAVCNFQYGHGFAFLSNNFGTGMPPTVGQGYIALIIPDPNIQPDEGRQAENSANSEDNTGESLSN